MKFALQHAKVLRLRGDVQEAILLLENASHAKISSSTGHPSDKVLRAKLLLNAVQWNILTNQKTPEEYNGAFREILNIHDSEKAYFALGLFQESVYVAAKKKVEGDVAKTLGIMPEEAERRLLDLLSTHMANILSSFGNALCKGHATVYQTLPKFLTRWLDTANYLHHITTVSSHKRSHVKASEVLQLLHVEVDKVLNNIAPYVLMTALPQIVSRIGHKNEEVIKRLKLALQKVLVAFPKQCLWYVHFVILSAQTNAESSSRREVLKSVYASVAKKVTNFNDMTSEFDTFAKGMIALSAEKPNANAKTISGKTIPAVVRIRYPTDVLLPTQEMLTILLPPSSSHDGSEDSASFFPVTATVAHMENDCEVLTSLQKPKKVTFRSSGGVMQSFLVKYKDETRKDSRMMEYCGMVNRLLKKDADARKRRLHIPTFCVLPLNDDSGIIEWVNGVIPMRNCIENAVKGNGLTHAQLKVLKEKGDANPKLRLRIFVEDILAVIPPVLHKWFLTTFPDPTSWFAARLEFTRTCAVASMVGHLVGLGDRHGENLLLEVSAGRVMHVDFACLFDKGETLEVPERVRFRLTQNMEDAMGITGVEGVFRKSCEVTLRIQQRHKDTLIGILETFVHDPLVEWSVGGENKSARQRQGGMDPKTILERVGRRFDGFPDISSDQSQHMLNVEGVVQKLISNTTSPETLSMMYFWWMPWM